MTHRAPSKKEKKEKPDRLLKLEEKKRLEEEEERKRLAEAEAARQAQVKTGAKLGLREAEARGKLLPTSEERKKTIKQQEREAFVERARGGRPLGVSKEELKLQQFEQQIRDDILKTEIEEKIFQEQVIEKGLPTGERLPDIPQDIAIIKDTPIDISESTSGFVTLMTQFFPETSRILGIDIAADIQNKLNAGKITRSQANLEYFQRGSTQIGDLLDTGIDRLGVGALAGSSSQPNQVEDAMNNFDETMKTLKELVQGIRDTGDPDLMDYAIFTMSTGIQDLANIEDAWHGEARLNSEFARDGGLQIQEDLYNFRIQLVDVRERIIGAQDAANRRSIGLPRGIPQAF